FTLKLATLIKQALRGQLTENRIKEIGRRVSTLAEAEAAIASGGETDVRLISLFGTADPIRMLTMVLTGEAHSRIDGADAWPSVIDLCLDAVGASIDSEPGSPADALFRHLLFTAVAASTGGSLRTTLRRTCTDPTTDQLDAATAVLYRPSTAPDETY